MRDQTENSQMSGNRVLAQVRLFNGLIWVAYLGALPAGYVIFRLGGGMWGIAGGLLWWIVCGACSVIGAQALKSRVLRNCPDDPSLLPLLEKWIAGCPKVSLVGSEPPDIGPQGIRALPIYEDNPDWQQLRDLIERLRKVNKASDATSESAPGADSSAHQV